MASAKLAGMTRVAKALGFMLVLTLAGVRPAFAGDRDSAATKGGRPRVLTLSGRDLIDGRGNGSRVLTNFFGGDAGNRGGIRVAVKDLDNDARADLVVGAGAGGGSRVTGYPGRNFAGGAAPELFGFDAFVAHTGGVFVG